MAEQRQPFRFRLPWLPAAAAPRPAPAPIPVQPAPTQPTTTFSTQRPPFRVLGIGLTQPPPQGQAHASPRAESQPQSPSWETAGSQITFQTSSQPSSPSKAAAQPATGAISQPSSPSKRLETSQFPPTYTQPKTLAYQPEESKPAVSQAQLQRPESKAQFTTEVAAARAPAPLQKSDFPTSSAEQGKDNNLLAFQPEESKPKVSLAQESQPKAEMTSDSHSTSWMAAQPSQAPGIVTAKQPAYAAAETAMPARYLKPDSYTRIDWKPHGWSEEIEERQKIEQELKEEEKTPGPVHEKPKQRAAAEILTSVMHSKTESKEQQTIAFQEEQKHLEKQEIADRKEILSTAGSSGKQIKTSTHKSESRPKSAVTNGERAPLHKEIQEDISKFVHKLTTGHPTPLMNEKPISIVNLIGENRGASMQLGPESAKKDGSVHIHRGYKANPDEGAETTTDGEGGSRGNPMITEDPAAKAYVNSNAQSINNSILLDGSVTERNPGVQLGITFTTAEPMESGSKEELLETRKAEFNVTPSQKMTYEPVVRRRCLRGLFLESSDSDPENPEKPRRHGCRYGCSEKGKDNKMDIL